MTTTLEILERDPMRNIVLLKHLDAFKGHCQLHQLSGASGTGSLVLLEVAASPYDRRTYPTASFAVLISSDDASLTRQLMAFVPERVGVVFKLASDADGDVVASLHAVTETTRVLSFTSRSAFQADAQVAVTQTPDVEALALFETEQHDRTWLLPLLAAGEAFACVLRSDTKIETACFAYKNYQQVWEIGGVVTPSQSRRRGYGARVVSTAVAELQRRGLSPRYQVHDGNLASIQLAKSIGLELFLTITHHLRAPVL